jgi:cytochrome bd ubiquinol oxidase subunit II
MEPSTLALFWAAVIAVAILAYVILDGFDLGVGILFGTTDDEKKRSRMIAAIGPFWDGNETWLVVIGASLFAAFPAVYAVFLGAFYLPVLLMLVGLIFRGIAFEFRVRSTSMRRFWDRGFFLGSVVVAFVQGAAVGALMRGLPVEDGQFAGTSFTWLHPFPILTGIGLVFGYALLGAGWLKLKSEDRLRDWAADRIHWLALLLFAVLGPAIGVAMTIDISAGLREAAARFDTGSLVLSGIAFYALLGVVASARGSRDGMPFALTALMFAAALATLATLMWPYMIPYELTVAVAAAPEASLRFFFYAGAVALPLIAVYTIGVYWVFRGKTESP